MDEFFQAAEMIGAGDLTGANHLLTKAVRTNPDDPRLWELLSRLVDQPEQAAYCRKRAADLRKIVEIPLPRPLLDSRPIPIIVHNSIKPTAPARKYPRQQTIGGCTALLIIFTCCLVGYAVIFPPGGGAGNPTPTAQVSLDEPESTPVRNSKPAVQVCSCTSNKYNCGSFSSPAKAQACYEYCLSLGAGDVHGLDLDNDGSACEK